VLLFCCGGTCCGIPHCGGGTLDASFTSTEGTCSIVCSCSCDCTSDTTLLSSSTGVASSTLDVIIVSSASNGCCCSDCDSCAFDSILSTAIDDDGTTSLLSGRVQVVILSIV